MSGEYYSIEEECSNLRDVCHLQGSRSGNFERRHCVGDGNDKGYTKKTQDYQLHEIEEQLQLAESRCNTLKGQLEFMKKNYQKYSPRDLEEEKSKCKIKDQRKRPVSVQPPSATIKNRFDLDQENFDIYPRRSSSSFPLPNEETKKPALVRQNSTSIGTDHTGAAVRTINHILSGITSSVNHLSQVQMQSNERPFLNDMGVGCAMPGKPFSPRLKKRLQEQQKRVEQIIQEARFPSTNDVKGLNQRESVAEEVAAPTRQVSLDKWSKSMTGQMKNKAQHSLGTINIPKFAKSNAKQVEEDALNMLKKRRRSIKRLKPTSKLSLTKKLSDSETTKRVNKMSSDNLVELYHNLAAKSSESDESTKAHTRQGAGDIPNACTLRKSPGILSPIQENKIVRSDYFNHIPKNYEQPTIASKLKKATKNYLRSFNYFNFRCIPFCAAKSTSPSHNIGINIQQVMSIIKTRQPITGISPTLAHNISLAAEKLQGSPLSAFVSNLSTRIGSGICPMSKHPLNYHKLQEMAKAIPEETYEEECLEELDQNATDNHPPKNEASSGVTALWTPEPSTNRCTCATQKTVPFQKVLSRYQMSSANTSKHTTSSIIKPPRRPNYVDSKQRTAAWVTTNIPEVRPAENKTNDQKAFKGKEKNLKAVLKNLHDEFEQLNTKYETLSKSAVSSSPEVLKQLEEMDAQLNQKEEEINMVMSLCTEVMALKDQVKRLKERASSETLTENKAANAKKEPNAALHLTQLLRQIQDYQSRYQNKN